MIHARNKAPWRRGLACLLTAALLPLTACSGFFVCQKASCPTTTTGTSTSNSGDYAYVANSSAGTTSLSEYDVSGGTLSSLGTLSLGYIPVAISVAPSNEFVYVASVPGTTTPGVYLYNVGSNGALTSAGNSPLAVDTVASMAISPDGKWLFTINISGFTMNEYSVNTGTGALTLAGNFPLSLGTCTLGAAVPVTQSCSVQVSPSGQYVVASLGASGDAVFSYSSTGGITSPLALPISSGSTTAHPSGDFSVAIDANNYAYVAQTSSVTVYAIASSKITNQGTVTYAAGSVPRSITLSKDGTHVFTANEGLSTISGFGISSGGALNATSNSPYVGPTSVAALGVDNTGAYLLAVGYDATAGVRLYSVDASTGVLTQVAAAGSGANTAFPALVAMTH